MKILRYVHDPNEFLKVRDLLEAHGIPTYCETQGEYTGRGALFVCINEQFDDAVALLKNPRHVVARPVDVAAFRAEIKRAGLTPVIRGAVLLLVFLVLIFVTAIAIRSH